MRISLNYTKSVEQNASIYFEQAKKAKKQLEGATIALEKSHEKLEKIKPAEIQKQVIKKKRKIHWFEKFRWFYTNEDMLFIAGRDATTNEIIIKKHTDNHDIVFHSEMSGSPFGVLKTEGKKPSKEALEECAVFVACYSKAWKLGLGVMDIFYVTPDQVTKEAPSGEFIGKGSFMIYGKKTILSVSLKLYIGKYNDLMMSAPYLAIKKHCEKYIEIKQGNKKTSDIAKKIKKQFNHDDLDDIVKILPVGSSL
ncbi:DUF814 domain-containing protein [archaeon]|mgnify:CR=1|jgi:predicted ribosome quality control (RQC) complex YloA/Tae2 family protein|nr:DUF814 domain-containing protein [archaeon]MBT4021962.1 DUF814 domain-containing protein [archaeon]MBT4272279.1 DUF814 domain-containing protein [archaeon]MBT4460815.1 DUF814 domain-containing protein [archaeon]MBT4858382.1 DUF814 domain-containing protein [archaeon]